MVNAYIIGCFISIVDIPNSDTNRRIQMPNSDFTCKIVEARARVMEDGRRARPLLGDG